MQPQSNPFSVYIRHTNLGRGNPTTGQPTIASDELREIWSAWQALRSLSAPELQLFCVVACGDVGSAVHNAHIELVSLTVPLSELLTASERCVRHAVDQNELDLRHAEEDGQPVEPIRERAAKLRDVHFILVEGTVQVVTDIQALAASMRVAVRDHRTLSGRI